MDEQQESQVEGVARRLRAAYGPDVAQEAVARGLRSGAFARVPPVPWAYWVTTARNVIRERARRRRLEARVADEIAREGWVRAGQLARAEAREALRDAPPEVALAAVLGPKRAAEVTGVPEGTVRTRLMRWRRRARVEQLNTKAEG